MRYNDRYKQLFLETSAVHQRVNTFIEHCGILLNVGNNSLQLFSRKVPAGGSYLSSLL